MAIESGLYHRGHYDRAAPVGSYWEATGGGPRARGRGAARAATSRPKSRSSAAATPACRRPTTSRASTASGRSCWRPGPIGWGASGRNGGFCGLGGSKLGYGAMAQRFGVPAAAPVLRRAEGGRGAGARPRRRGGDRPRGRRRGRALSRPPHQPLARAGERRRARRSGCSASAGRSGARPSSRSACCARPEAQGCLVVPHYFGLHPLRYVRGLARAAAARGAAVHAETPVPGVAARQRPAPAGDAGRHRDGRRGSWSPPTATRPRASTRCCTAGCCRRCRASSSPGRSRRRSRRRRAGHGRRWSPTRASSCSTSASCGTGACCSAPAAGSTPRPASSPPGGPGWSGDSARSSRPGAGCAVEFAWWGLVCLARDLLPHLGWLDESRTTLGAWAYHGSGVAFATMFGRAAAARLAGREPDPPLPAFLLTAAAAVSRRRACACWRCARRTLATGCGTSGSDSAPSS